MVSSTTFYALFIFVWLYDYDIDSICLLYLDETLVNMNRLLQKSSKDQSSNSEALSRENNILKSGIRIFNQKFEKLKAFTESMKQEVNQSQAKV